jgi:hypothetical protein
VDVYGTHDNEQKAKETVVIAHKNKFKVQIRLNLMRTMTQQHDNKLKVDIYVPLDACACVWDDFMNRMFEVLTPFMKNIDYNTKNLNSEEARKLKLYGNCVVVNGKIKFTSSYLLKDKLPNLLKEKDLI